MKLKNVDQTAPPLREPVSASVEGGFAGGLHRRAFIAGAGVAAGLTGLFGRADICAAASAGARVSAPFRSSDLGARSPRVFIYPPAADGPSLLPVMAFAHGGGWRKGSPRAVFQQPAFFARNGWLFASIGYRLDAAPGEQAIDVAEGLLWLAAHAKDYGGDGSRIAAMGHSAGAHLVMLAAIADWSPARTLVERGIWRWAISNDIGVYDLPAAAAHSRIKYAGRGGDAWVRKLFGEDPEEWRRLSPIFQLRPGAKLPAILVTSSKPASDSTWHVDQARAFAARIKAVGGRASLYCSNTLDHMGMVRKMGVDAKLSSAVLNFLRA